MLIADDEEKMVRALSDLFRAKGFEVIKAYDGKQALDEYCKNNTKVDVVLLDVMMPEIDKFEVADEIRRSVSLVPIILITALSLQKRPKISAIWSAVCLIFRL